MFEMKKNVVSTAGALESVNGLFISISNCETFTNYQIYHLRKYLRPTLCLNKSLLLPKPSVLINLGTNDKFPGKFSELWQRYEQVEPFTPQAANI